MKAVILAAGKGTRMQPLTLTTPKPMLPLLGKPLLAHIIDSLPSEIDELFIVVGYLGTQIKDFFGTEWKGRKIAYFEQEELNGHIPALNLVRPALGKGRFLMAFADDLHDPESMRKLLSHERAILVSPVPNPERFGIVVPDAQNNIVEFEEKPKQPKSNLAFTGMCVLDEHVFDYEPEVHENGEYYLPPVIQKMAKDHPVHVEQEEFWLPIGYPEDLKKAEEVLASEKAGAAS